MKLTAPLFVLATVGATATATATAESGCNPELQLAGQPDAGLAQAQHPLGGEATYGTAQLHTLPLQGDSGPACLDGTPYGFYFQPSTTGSTKWTVSIDGGGWWCALLASLLFLSLPSAALTTLATLSAQLRRARLPVPREHIPGHQHGSQTHRRLQLHQPK
jgi:hypothetical protein